MVSRPALDCPHRQDPDQCLVCWADWNLEVERLRVQFGLSREEFLELVKDCLARRKAMIVMEAKSHHDAKTGKEE